MELSYFESSGFEIAEIISEEKVLMTTQDALDIMANAQYQGASHIIIYEKQLNPDFFDLRTGLAGDILQKFSNYQMKLLIIGEFTKFKSKSLVAFIAESNRVKQVVFVADKEAALEKIAS